MTFRVLVDHFYGRFFDNEFVSRDAEVRVTVTHILALLALPGLFLSLFMMPYYAMLVQQRSLAIADQASWSHKLLFAALTTTVVGLVTVLEWDALFPDRRDHAILGSLPLKARTIFAAKITALIVFLLIFCGVLNGLATFFFPIAVTTENGTLRDASRMMVAHFVVMLAASTFVFLFFIALEGMLINLLPVAIYRRMATLVQLVSIVALLLVLLFYNHAALRMYGPRSEAWILDYYPPAWFVGIYQQIVGRSNALFDHLASRAWSSLWIVGVFAAAGYAACYRRFVRKSYEALPVEPRKLETGLAGWANRVLLRDPVERAVFHFAWITVFRSARHRLFLCAYAGVGFALVAEALVANGSSGLLENRTVLLSLPLIVSFFVLSGLRIVFAIPAHLGSNWIFRVAGPASTDIALRATRKAILILAVAPLIVLIVATHLMFTDVFQAIGQAVYVALLSVLLTEVLLLRFPKIPFTCSYLPGKANITLTAGAYWTFFTLYAYSLASLEMWVLESPKRFALTCCLFLYLLKLLRDFRRNQIAGLVIFDERPASEWIALGLR